MTLPRAFDIMEAWGKVPPLHWMVAAYLGIGKEEDKKEEPNWEELAALMGTTLQKRTKDE